MNPLIPHLFGVPGGHRGAAAMLSGVCCVCACVGFGVSVVPTAPGGLPGLGVMPRYAQADLLPDFEPPVGLQEEDFHTDYFNSRLEEENVAAWSEAETQLWHMLISEAEAETGEKSRGAGMEQDDEHNLWQMSTLLVRE